MRHTLGSYRRLLGAQLRSQLQYRTSFILDVLATMLVTLTEFGAIALVFGRFGELDGWTLGEVAFLYGLVELSFGLMDMVFAGFDPARFGQEVRKGTFDRLLLRPLPLTWQVLGSDLTLRRVGRVALGVAIFALALNLNPLVWTAAKLILPTFRHCRHGAVFRRALRHRFDRDVLDRRVVRGDEHPDLRRQLPHLVPDEHLSGVAQAHLYLRDPGYFFELLPGALFPK